WRSSARPSPTRTTPGERCWPRSGFDARSRSGRCAWIRGKRSRSPCGWARIPDSWWWAPSAPTCGWTTLAARLQQLAEPGAILISDATARLVDGYALLERRGSTEIRGRAEPVVVHALVGAGARRSRLDDAGSGLSRFVGRGRELATLTDLLDHVEQGDGQVVGIVGEPGV